ncbi:MAG: M23 family metallopeptidase, partial [bacterium]|nr:M23 family metallopeptidase [bacterium]
KEKENIEAILRLMHKEDGKTALEIILLNDSLTDFINQVKYLEDINKEIGDSVNKLKQYKEELEQEEAVLAGKKQDLEKLKKDLDDKKQALVSEQENKSFVLDQTRSSEKEYQRLLTLAKQEQEQAAAEIVSLEKTVREKIAKMQDKKLEFNDAGLIWPVPKNIITSYFHDPDYPFRYIFEHPAIDIRAGLGTVLRAAASGYVARAKDAGKGYSYIMIIHGDGLATVYGHVSAIYVKEDEYVVQGQTIGKSGGLPGTSGAGRLTTGSHLHFEVRLNGIPVNPLEYLP